jgi:hypothetical protein
MHYVDKPNPVTAEGVTIGRENGVGPSGWTGIKLLV